MIARMSALARIGRRYIVRLQALAPNSALSRSESARSRGTTQSVSDARSVALAHMLPTIEEHLSDFKIDESQLNALSSWQLGRPDGVLAIGP